MRRLPIFLLDPLCRVCRSTGKKERLPSEKQMLGAEMTMTTETIQPPVPRSLRLSPLSLRTECGNLRGRHRGTSIVSSQSLTVCLQHEFRGIMFRGINANEFSGFLVK